MIPFIVLAMAASGCVPAGADVEQITAGDLARQWPALAAIAAATPLALAPLPGAERIFHPGDLARLAARFHLDAPPATPICVVRRASPLTPARLLEAMHRVYPKARIELVDYCRFMAPEGEIVFPPAGLLAGRWSGYVTYGKGRRFAIWAQAKVEVPMPRVVAVQPLHAGQAVTAAQVRVEDGYAVPREDGRARTLDEVVGKLPRRPVASGELLMRAALAEPFEVVRGDTVRVEVTQGSAHLELDAIAETAARRGERVRLLNPESQRRFLARVTGKGRAIAGPQEARP